MLMLIVVMQPLLLKLDYNKLDHGFGDCMFLVSLTYILTNIIYQTLYLFF